MKRALFITACAVFALSAYADVRDEPPGVSIIGSPQERLPDVRRVSYALDLAQKALGRKRLQHIHIVLICADKETGRTQGIADSTPVRVIHFTDAEPPTYHVFIVGGVSDSRLAWASVAVIAREWGMHLEKKQVDEITHRVRLGLSGVVSANELAKRD